MQKKKEKEKEGEEGVKSQVEEQSPNQRRGKNKREMSQHEKKVKKIERSPKKIEQQNSR